jgi:hypothetical protein
MDIKTKLPKTTHALIATGLAQILLASKLSIAFPNQNANNEIRNATIESYDTGGVTLSWWDSNSGCSFNTGCGKDNA